jgi:hypothetical protein
MAVDFDYDWKIEPEMTDAGTFFNRLLMPDPVPIDEAILLNREITHHKRGNVLKKVGSL